MNKLRTEIFRKNKKTRKRQQPAPKRCGCYPTRKGNQTYYGYKDHVKANVDSKLITDYAVTTASTHDSQPMPTMINKTDKVVYADSAYWGRSVADALPAHVENQIHKRGTKKNPLTEDQKANNKRKSKSALSC